MIATCTRIWVSLYTIFRHKHVLFGRMFILCCTICKFLSMKIAAAFPVRTPSYGERQCYISHRTNHIARDCFYREQHPRYNNNAGSEYSQSNRVSNVDSEKQQKGSSMIDEYMMGNTRMMTEGGSKERMPVCEGLLSNRKVQVLRYTGCRSAAVKLSLVEKYQLTGNEVTCTLIDGTQRKFPLALIPVDTPYFAGVVEAMCMGKPLYDLILGNIPSVSDIPDPRWRKECNAVTTRAQAEKEKRPIKPLKVPTAELHDVNMETLIQAQQNDKTLQKMWKIAEQVDTGKSQANGSWRIEVHKSILSRVYEDRRGEASRVMKQIMVAQIYRYQVMKLAHEAIVGGHLGAKKTTDRVTSSFHWPGITGDIRRFCQSCDLCERMIPKGKNCKVPLGEIPLTSEPFERIAVDLIGPIKPVTEQGSRYILTIIDFATRYPETIPLKSIETERVAETWCQYFVCYDSQRRCWVIGEANSHLNWWKK